MRFHPIIASAAIAVSITAASANQPFDKFPVGAAYSGPPAMPDFTGRDREFKEFSTRIQDGIKEGANFAGRYKVIPIGCGTGCSFIVVANVSTGQVYTFPHGGEDDQMLRLEYQVSSNLIRAWWVPNLQNTDQCLEEDFLLKNGQFVSLGRSGPAACAAGYSRKVSASRYDSPGQSSR